MHNIAKIIKENEYGQLFENEEMKYHTSIRCGGTVKYLYIPDCLKNLETVYKLLVENNIRYKVIGKGSNILFMDGEIDLFVIKICNVLDFLEINDNGIIRVGAGYSVQRLAKQLSKLGHSGMEFAGGIPGTIGGLVYMNGGAHTADASTIVSEVETLSRDGQIKIYNTEMCDFGYRSSVFQKNNEIILSVTLNMPIKDKAEVFKRMSGNLQYRKEMQPLQLPSFGSVFRNPENNHAGKLIEECELKGLQIGGAQISTKHANFIVNNGNATVDDVLQLIQIVKDTVFEKYNIKLQTEVEVVKKDE